MANDVESVAASQEQHGASGRRRASREAGPRIGRPLIILLLALLVSPPLIGYAVSAVGPTTYAARAEFLIGGAAQGNDAERQAATLLSVMDTNALLDPLAKSHARTVAEVRRSIEREQLESGNVIRVTVEDQDSDVALSIAEDLTDAYVALVAGLRDDTAQQDVLNERIASLTARQSDTRDELLALAGSQAQVDVESARQLQVESDLLQQQISALLGQVIDLESNAYSAASSVRPVGTPYLLQGPVGPQPLRSAAAGLLIGILLSAALAAVVLRKSPTA